MHLLHRLEAAELDHASGIVEQRQGLPRLAAARLGEGLADSIRLGRIMAVGGAGREGAGGGGGTGGDGGTGGSGCSTPGSIIAANCCSVSSSTEMLSSAGGGDRSAARHDIRMTTARMA
jgi:hypothetical protein